MKTLKEFKEGIENNIVAKKHRAAVNSKIASHNSSISNNMNDTRELLQTHVSHNNVHFMLNKKMRNYK
jgi:hypothetical protein